MCAFVTLNKKITYLLKIGATMMCHNELMSTCRAEPIAASVIDLQQSDISTLTLLLTLAELQSLTLDHNLSSFCTEMPFITINNKCTANDINYLRM